MNDESTQALPYDPYYGQWRGSAQPPPPPVVPPDTVEFGGAERMPRPRRRKASIVIAAVAVLALLAGTAAVAGAYVWYGWGATLPEQVVPGSTAAFARFDLSPGLGQRLRIANLAKKFPARNGAKDRIDELERGLLGALGLGVLNYDADIAPWFAARVGVGVWARGGTGAACAIQALASKDDAKAAAALEKVRRVRGDRYSFAFLDGYAVATECAADDAQSTAEAAVAAARAGSLAQRPEFADGLHRLPPGQFGVGWVDAAALVRTAQAERRSPGLLAGYGDLSGHLVAGIRAVDNGVELRYRWRGAQPLRSSRDVLADLGAMPANTAVAAAADLSALTQAHEGLRYVLDHLRGRGTRAALLRDGTLALLGSVVSLAIADTDILKDRPGFRLTVRAADATQAGLAGDLVRALYADAVATGDRPDFELIRTDNQIEVSVGGYGGSGGSLGQNPLYQEAMAGATGPSTVGVFVNLRQIFATSDFSPAERREFEPLQAIGATGGVDGDTMVGLVRVIIR